MNPRTPRSPSRTCLAIGGVLALALALAVAFPPQAGAAASFEATGRAQTFVPPVPVLGWLPRAAVGDLNEDGLDDLMTVGTYLTVLLSNGIGGFQTPRYFEIGRYLNRVHAGDVDGDGHVDALVCGHGLFLLRGRGDGTFAAAETLYSDNFEVEDVAVASFDNDTRLDLVVSHYCCGVARVSLLRGSSNGSFSSPVDLAPSDAGLAVGDIDADGDQDLVVLGSPGSPCLVYTNRGNAQLDPPLALGGPGDAVAVDLVDVWGDAAREIVVRAQQDNRVQINSFLPTTRTFGPPTYLHATRSTCEAVVMADVNGDGRTDGLVLGGSGDVRVYLGDGAGSFTISIEIPTLGESNTNTLVVANTDGDGHPDIVTYSQDGYAFQTAIHPGRPTGGFGGTWRLSTGFPLLYDLDAADLDLDGALDLVALWDSLGIGLRQPDGRFTLRKIPAGSNPKGFALGDIDHDGRTDIVVVGWRENSTNTHSPVTVLHGNGDGTFTTTASYISFVPTGAFKVLIANVDGDGHPDLLVLHSTAPFVTWFSGNGNGTFTWRGTIPFPGSASSVDLDLAAADVTGDGLPDLLLADRPNSRVILRRNLGGGSFAAGTDLNGIPGASRLATVDLNGDGNTDLVVGGTVGSSAYPGHLSVLLGTGGGSFAPPVVQDIAAGPSEIRVADVDGDGISDALTVGWSFNAVTVFRGTGDGRLTPLENDLCGPAAGRVVVSDFDGDGRPDLAVTGRQEAVGNQVGDVTLLRNLTDPLSAPGRPSPGSSVAVLGVRPNPARSRVRTSVRLVDASIAKLEVFDLDGRRVAVQRLESRGPGVFDVVIEARGLRPGLYHLRLTAGRSTANSRFCLLR